MKKNLFLLAIISVVLSGVLAFTSLDISAEKDQKQPAAELTKYAPDKMFPGLTLYPEESSERVYLLGEEGHKLHEWKIDADRAVLLPNCNLIAVHGTKWGTKREPWRSLRDTIREYDWEGNVVWEFSSDEVFHHDVKRLPNGNTLILQRVIVPEGWQLRIEDPTRRMSKLRGDKILEVSPDGKVVWSWNAHEHLDINNPGHGGWTRYTSPNGAKFRMQDWTHINTVNVLPDNKWFQAGDKRFKPGNLLIHARNWSTTMLINKENGDVVWSYHGDYRGGISGGHEPHMIDEGLPGAGNILLFDNGKKTHDNESIILEINPVNKSMVWKYENGKDFYSEAAGSVQRLPNGNTLISEDRRGRVFEVTKKGDIVWEYQGSKESNRARRYSRDYCPRLSSLADASTSKSLLDIVYSLSEKVS